MLVKGESTLSYKMRKLLVGALCLCVVSGCSAKASEVVLVSGIGDQPAVAKAEVNKSISLIDPRDGKEVKTIDLEGLGYFESEEKFQKEITKVVKELGKKVDTQMVAARVGSDGSWQPGESGYELMEKEFVDQIMNVGMWESSYQLPIKEHKPVAMQSDASGSGTVLGRYETDMGATTGGRIENIRLSAQSSSGIILGKGDRYSFNAIIGNTTPDKGYQLGKEIVNGKLVDGYGGGVCQTSSTLYNAADRAGLKMVQRTTHSKEVGYVPKGRDATIAYPYLDLVFENPYDHPVKLVMYTEGQKLIAEVRSL